MTKRYPPLTVAEIKSRLDVNMESGRVFWRAPSKYHARLIGQEAGCPRPDRHGSLRWVVKLKGIPYKRAQLVLMLKTGRWPSEMVDHRNGDTLDDRPSNLRHASAYLNAQNHRTRAKKSPLPMGVRQLPSGLFQARIAHKKQQLVVGLFNSPAQAHTAYIAAKQELSQ